MPGSIEKIYCAIPGLMRREASSLGGTKHTGKVSIMVQDVNGTECEGTFICSGANVGVLVLQVL